MKPLAVFVLLLCLACFACNPVRRIDMVNKTTDTVRFVWTLNEDSLAGNPFLMSNSSKLSFTLASPKTKTIRLSFGAGSWTEPEVQKLTGYLRSLEITSPSQKIKLDSLPQLREFLLGRRKGLGGARIEIAVTDALQAKN